MVKQNNFSAASLVDNIHLDAIAWRDDYTVAEAGVDDTVYPTLLTIRTRTEALISKGGATGYTQAYLDSEINQAQRVVIRRLGDTCRFMEVEQEITLTGDALGRVTMPAGVGRIIALNYSTDTSLPLAWNKHTQTPEGRMVIIVRPRPTTTTRRGSCWRP